MKSVESIYKMHHLIDDAHMLLSIISRLVPEVEVEHETDNGEDDASA